MDLNTTNLLSRVGAAGVDNQYYDLVALVRDSPCLPNRIAADASTVSETDILSVRAFQISPEQEASEKRRYAGEGADSATFTIGEQSVRGRIEMPLFAPMIGWIDPGFARLWELARYAANGTGTAIAGSLLAPLNAGDDAILTDNAGEFAGYGAPFTAVLTGGGAADETITVSDVDKRGRTLQLTAAVTQNRQSTAKIYVYPGTPGTACDPAFSIWSLSEGLAAPCLVDRLTLTAEAEADILINAEVRALALWRDRQISLRTRAADLLSSYAALPRDRTVHSIEASLLPIDSTITGGYGMPSVVGQELLAGYEHLSLAGTLLQGFSITIDNQLDEVYSLSSVDNSANRVLQNAQPLALVSSGRRISGTLTCLSPLEPWALADRLAGLSGWQGGGIALQFGPCRIPLTDIVWKPGRAERSVESDTRRILDWSIVGNGVSPALPPLLAAATP